MKRMRTIGCILAAATATGGNATPALLPSNLLEDTGSTVSTASSTMSSTVSTESTTAAPTSPPSVMSGDDYMAQLPFSVEVVTPKFSLIGTEGGYAAEYCAGDAMAVIMKVLKMDEDALSGLLGAQADLKSYTRSGATLRDALTFVGDYVDRLHKGKNLTPDGEQRRVKMFGLPYLMPADSLLPSEQIRNLLGAHTLMVQGGRKYGELFKLHSQLPKHRKYELIDTLINHSKEKAVEAQEHTLMAKIRNVVGDAADRLSEFMGLDGDDEATTTEGNTSVVGFGDSDLKSGIEPYAMDVLSIIPDQLVAFLSSRAVGELLGVILQDSHTGGVSAGGKQNLGTAICRGIEFGMTLDPFPEWTACALPSAMLALVVCMYKDFTLDCTNYTVGDPMLDVCDKVEQKEIMELTPFLPMEDALDLDAMTYTNSGLAAEGETLLKLQIALARQGLAAFHHQCTIPVDDPYLVKDMAPGWDFVHEVWLNEESSTLTAGTPNKYVPFTTIGMKKKTGQAGQANDGTCEFLTSTRGTNGIFEWWANVQMDMIPIPYSLDAKAKAHRGYTVLSSSVADSLVRYWNKNHFELDDHNDPNWCDPAKTTLWFTGHSLGGGMSNMQSLATALRLKPSYPDLTIFNYAAASLAVYNKEALDMHNSLINARNFRYDRDMVPGVPCQNTGIQRCSPAEYPSGFQGTGVEEPVQYNPGQVMLRSKEDFADFDPEHQWWFNDDWFLPQRLALAVVPILMPGMLQLNMSHSCSYRCFLTSRFCSDSPYKHTMCYRGPLALDDSACWNEDVSNYVKAPGVGGGDPPAINRQDEAYPGYVASMNCTYNAEAAKYISTCDWTAGISLDLSSILG
ncbi:lipase [Gregarina niphandrodes]|uniref:Lipase n=1 Tax=Gregarina niphandrodes TaxID=110365 RepID=A0A023AZB9_GRENI|nr:lipase [Gregarina niphandrodes]EZG43660.1 lipase [Gregarina niphandrodes]|eukprot:XP_011133106.1 lipase [Gregarina niphandrodes]